MKRKKIAVSNIFEGLFFPAREKKFISLLFQKCDYELDHEILLRFPPLLFEIRPLRAEIRSYGVGGRRYWSSAPADKIASPPLHSSVSQPPEVGFQKVRVENALEFHNLARGANRFAREILWKEGPRFYFENLQKC